MRKTSVCCDVCGREDYCVRPELYLETPCLPTMTGEIAGKIHLFSGKDLCLDCQRRLLSMVSETVERFLEVENEHIHQA